MGKLFTRFMLTLVGLILLVGLCLFFFREAVVEQLLDSQLTQLGIPVHAFRVQTVSLNHIELQSISLGASSEVRIQNIQASWSLPDLVQGELQGVVMSGLRLVLDLRGENPPLGSLQNLLEKEADNSSSKPLPPLSLQHAQVDLLTDYGEVQFDLNGDITHESTGESLIKLTFDAEATQGQATGEFNAKIDSAGKIHGNMTFSEAALTLADVSFSGVSGNSVFNLVDNQLQDIAAEVTLADIRLPSMEIPATAFEQARLKLQMDTVSADLTGQLLTDKKVEIVSFDANLQDYTRQPAFTVNINAIASHDTALWPLLGLPQPNSGIATLNLEGRGQTPALPTAGNNWMNWLQQILLRSDGSLNIEGLGFSRKISELNADIKLKASLEEGAGKITLMEGGLLEAAGLDQEWLTQLGLPVDNTTVINQATQLRIQNNRHAIASVKFDAPSDGIKTDITSDVSLLTSKTTVQVRSSAEFNINQQHKLSDFALRELAVTASGIDYAGHKLDHLSLVGNIQGSIDNWSGELDLSAEAKRLQLDVLDARRAKAELPLQLGYNNHSWQFALHRPGRITFGKLAPFGSFQIQGPLTLRLPSANYELTPGSGDIAQQHRITLRPDRFNVLLNRADATAIEAKIEPGKIVLRGTKAANSGYKGKYTISSAAITLPQQQMQLNQIASTLYLGHAGEGMTADFIIGQALHTADKAFIAPAEINGKITLRNNQLTVKANGGVSDNRFMNLTAVHSLSKESGHLTVATDPLTFTPGDLQPATLFPVLSDMENVSGKVSASNQFSWSNQAVHSGGQFVIENLSFRQSGNSVSGINAALEMTDLLTPRSKPRQSISIQHIALGLPMDNLDIMYQIEAEKTSRLAIEKANLSILGGTLKTGAAVIDPASAHNDIVIQVENIDLGELFEFIEVEGLAGEGHLDGSIPLVFDDGQVAIKDGRLAANQPGILRIKSEKLSDILGGRVKDVDLLLEALTEFHYTELTLKLNNSASNDLVVALSMLGNNPTVLEGRLFRLNINLESNISKILNAIAQGYGLSNKALQRALRLR